MSTTLLSEKPATLEQRLRTRAATLGAAQLESDTWRDLHLALKATAAGKRTLVQRWIDSVEAGFLNSWEGYEQSEVLNAEVTSESVLGHQILLEGIECWLEALAELRANLRRPDASAILGKAEEGQRLLVAVQLLQEEADDPVARFRAAWSN